MTNDFRKHATATVARPLNWERSFPHTTFDGTDWIIDVLDDLAAFSAHQGLTQVEKELCCTKVRVASLLGIAPDL